MNRQSQHELFSQRPVRSDFARGRSGGGLNLQKLFLVFFGIAAAIGVGYAFSTMGPVNDTPEQTPTIQAEMPIKQRPEEPGGIDIPHQDVTVFQKIDNSNGTQVKKDNVEHLLPEPETPKDISAPANTTEAQPQPSVAAESVSDPVAAPPAKAEESLPPAITEAAPAVVETPAKAETPEPPLAAKKEETKKQEVVADKKPNVKEKTADEKAAAAISAAKKLESSLTRAKSSAETIKGEAASSRLPKELFMNEAGAGKTSAPASPTHEPAAVPETAAKPAEGAGGARKAQIQLASYPSQAEAEREIKKFQNKYASALGQTALSVVKADIPGKGTYFRIMGSAGTAEKAKSICADVVRQKGNCLVVK